MKTRNPLEIAPGLRRSIFYCIGYAAEIVRKDIDKIARNLGLSDYSNLVLLLCVSETGGILSQADLGKVLRINPNSMVQRVDAMEKLGYLRREKNLENRRRYHINLTDKAEKLLEDFRKIEIQVGSLDAHAIKSLKNICCSIIDSQYKK